MFKPERLLLFAILVTALAACGTPATPAPTLEPTLVLPTRVPVQSADVPARSVNQPTAVAVQPTTAPTTAPAVAPTKAAASPTQIPATQVPPTATVGIPATATKARTAAATAASGGAAAAGNPGRGQQIFNGVGTCSTCHNVASDAVLVGPSLKGVASRAGTRKPGMSASDYLRESIISPNAYVVSGFQPGIMPQTFKQMLTPQQIDDVVAYLLTLK